MKVFQLLKRIGGFYNLKSFHSSFRRVPSSLLSQFQLHSAMQIPRPSSFLLRSSAPPVRIPMVLCQTSAQNSFSDIRRHSFSNDVASDSVENDIIIDEAAWDAYAKAMVEVLSDLPEKPNKKLSSEQFTLVKHYLFSKEHVHNSSLIIYEEDGVVHDFRTVLDDRKESFLNATGFTFAQYELTMRCFTYLASKCAKTQTILPLLVAWSKIKDGGMALKPNFISTFTYVFGLEETYLGLSSEVATFHALLYGVTENAIYLRIKALVAMGSPVNAEKLLTQLKDDGKECRRLRTFAPILKYYCNQGDIFSVLRLWTLIRAAPGAYLDAETYALILGTVASHGAFKAHAECVEGLTDIGLSPCGPELLDDVFSRMMEDLVEIPEEAAVTIYNSLLSGFTGTDDSTAITEDPTSPTVPPCTTIADKVTGKPQLITGRVTIDRATATCPCTGAKLRLFTLDENQRRHVRDMLMKMAATQHEEFHANRFKKKGFLQNSQAAVEGLEKFSDWLENRGGEPFTAFVDGANVAYFGHGSLRYSQVLRVVQELEKMGERPLVIMPQKYANAHFRLANGQHQSLTEPELNVIASLVKEGKLFITPHFDDYYWMMASVSTQDGVANIPVPRSDATLFPGIRPILISNDQMRDHKMELLEPHLFRRWYSSHIVTYSISPFEEDEWEPRAVSFAPADSFSREIQGNAMDGELLKGKAWHLPISDWEARSDRFCIAVPR